MTYSSTIRFLKKLKESRFDSRLDSRLNRIKTILSVLGNPEKNIVYAHVTGTNGKGSVSAMIASILQASGYRVGLYTSPHLDRYNERIKINGKDISDNEFVSIFKEIQQISKSKDVSLGFFELLTIMAFLYFFQKKTEVAVLEVGMGGSLDSTNVINGLVSVITNVGLEHAEILGPTKQDIALEKAGIIKPGSIAVTTEPDEKIRTILKKKAKKIGAELKIVEMEDIFLKRRTAKGQVFNFCGLNNVHIPLIGEHQLLNAGSAILAAKGLKEKGLKKVNISTIRKGLKDVKWPLRLEIIHRAPTVLVDAAHNPHGVKSIVKSIETLFPSSNRILIMGCALEKDYLEMTKLLSSLSKTIIITQAEHYASPSLLAENIVDASKKKIFQSSNIRTALLKAKELADKKTLIMILGGMFLAIDAKALINSVFNEPHL